MIRSVSYYGIIGCKILVDKINKLFLIESIKKVYFRRHFEMDYLTAVSNFKIMWISIINITYLQAFEFSSFFSINV